MKDLKDHEIAALVNELRDTAVQYRDTQQLRDRISRIVNTALAPKDEPAAADFDAYMTGEYGKRYERASFSAYSMRGCWSAAQHIPLQLPQPGTTEYGSWINRAQNDANQSFSWVSDKFKWLCHFEQSLRRLAGDTSRKTEA